MAGAERGNRKAQTGPGLPRAAHVAKRALPTSLWFARLLRGVGLVLPGELLFWLVLRAYR